MGFEKNLELAFDILLQCGSGEYFGERVTMTEHMIQTADIALENNAEADVVIASLFHDIGHILPKWEGYKDISQNMDGYGIYDHELIGAKFMFQIGFPKMICYH